MGTDATLSRDLIDLAAVVKNTIRREFLAKAGAPTLTQARILRKIQDGVRHVGKLSEAFGISQPATSIMVNTMVRQGLLRRVALPTDRRQIELRLTAKATAHLKTGHDRAYSAIDRKLALLSSAKRSTLSKQIRELTELLSTPDAGKK